MLEKYTSVYGGDPDSQKWVVLRCIYTTEVMILFLMGISVL